MCQSPSRSGEARVTIGFTPGVATRSSTAARATTISSADLGDDRIFGGPGNDTLIGGPGNDRLEGEEGSDGLRGDEGNDVLFGGDGRR